MTIKTDVAAIVPTANARAVAQARGYNLDNLLQQLQQQAIELQTTVREVLKIHPTGGPDAANVTALNAILTALL